MTPRRACWLVLLVLGVAACGRDAATISPPASSTVPPLAATATPPPQPDELEPIPPPVERQDDPDLWEEVSYVAQMGQEGQQSAKSGAVVTAPVPTLIRAGTRSTEQVEQDAVQLVQAYLTAYQSGQWEQLAELTRAGQLPISPTASEAAGVQIISFSAAPLDLAAIQAESLGYRDALIGPSAGRDFDLGGAIHEPFGIEAKVRTTVEMSVFGSPLVWEGDLLAIWQPEAGWKMQPWGVLAAGASGETVAGATLKGVAVFPRDTLAVIAQEPQPPVYVTVAERQTGGNALILTRTDPATASGWAWMPRVDPLLDQVTVEMAVGFGAGRQETTIQVSVSH